MNDIIRSLNPAGVHPPAGAYTHSILLPATARTLYVAGQVGIRIDGSLPASLADQADQVFANLVTVLSANGMEPRDIVKLTTYLVLGQEGAVVGNARRAHLGEHKAAATFIFVPQLYSPDWLLEVDAVAARV